METRRLKNIVIFILLFLNLFLLLLVASQLYAAQRSEQELTARAYALLEKNHIEIQPELLTDSDLLRSCSYGRDFDAEAAFAHSFFENASEEHTSGGASLYSGTDGSVSFLPNGSLTLQTARPLPMELSYEDFIRAHCPAHYSLGEVTKQGSSTVVTAVPTVDGLPVYGAPITFHFARHALVSADGFFLSGAAGTPERSTLLSRSAAAISLMDHCRQEGHICSRISEISDGYLLQSTLSAPLLLTPVYQIRTNTYSYYVNALDGHVSTIR